MQRHDAAIKHLGNHWASLHEPQPKRTRPASRESPRGAPAAKELTLAAPLWFWPAGDGALRTAPPIGSLHCGGWNGGEDRRRKDPSTELFVQFILDECVRRGPQAEPWLFRDTKF
ncbi:hypothetical protein M440DRAFT_176149 [Trichoderma longibrachiatum ATCC 18648]|uniref:Uncharacterized protein n=1 Tax=Trichoderma longibrachiatum ATCC 18648 TaxID=983965 RepID=A0A2T4CEN8_TRILO|nr:hypothetical protein M440DRAFT_176149 [Trichoderma longibrachiatum ATCC 18648]